MTKRLASLLNSDPVITTATDTEDVQAIDTLAQRYHGWYPEFKYNTKLFNTRLVEGKPLLLYIDPDFRGIVNQFNGFEVIDEIDQQRTEIPLVIISDKSGVPKRQNSLQIVPQVNVLGVGSRRDVSYKMMQDAFVTFCDQQQLNWHSICKVVSIQKKKNMKTPFTIWQTAWEFQPPFIRLNNFKVRQLIMNSRLLLLKRLGLATSQMPLRNLLQGAER